MPATQPDELLTRWTELDPESGAAGAAVLILLRRHGPDVDTLLIQRENRPNDLAAGQVSLPGGRSRPEDGTLRETALRESAEEVGLEPGDLARPPQFIELRDAPVFGLRVAVFAAPLVDGAGRLRVVDEREVAGLFWLPRSRLADRTDVPRPTPQGPRPFEAVVYEGHVVWGFTLRVLDHFFGGSA